MNKEIILGSFFPQEGGSIYLSMLHNMQHRTEMATHVHELSHMFLENATTIGFVHSLLQMEKYVADDKDPTHSRKMAGIASFLTSFTTDIHEIYANNIELLWIAENLGTDIFAQVFSQKPATYQDFYNQLSDINADPSLTFEQKVAQVNEICFYALNIEIGSQAFLDVLPDGRKLREYLKQPLNDPKQRLRYAVNCCLSKQTLSSGALFEQAELFLEKVLSAPCPVFIYSCDYFEQLLELLRMPLAEMLAKTGCKPSSGNSAVDLEQWTAYTQQAMEKRIRIFVLELIPVQRNNCPPAETLQGFLAIKNAQNLSDKNKFYLVGHSWKDKDFTCWGYEKTETECQDLVWQKKFFAILSEEKKLPVWENLFKSHMPRAILISTYNSCFEILSQLRGKEIYVGRIYEDSNPEFFDILFFRLRTCPEEIYIFPSETLLVSRIIEELGLSRQLLVPSTNSPARMFLCLFSAFEDEISMSGFLRWLVSLFMQSVDYGAAESPAFRLARTVTVLLGDSCLHIKRSDYYRLLSSLPTQNTQGAPFWALMQFKNGWCTGELYLDNRQNLVPFFCRKSDAQDFLHLHEQFTSKTDLQVVGIDKFYWLHLEKALRDLPKEQQFVAVCVNGSQAVRLPLEAVNQMIQEYGERT